MLAHYYTVLHTFSEEEGFPSPPPPMDSIIQDWEIAHQPIQDEIENMGCLKQGKALRQAQAQNQQGAKRPSLGGRTLTSTSISSNISVRTAPPPMFAPKPPFASETRPVSPASSYVTPRASISVASSASTPPLPSGGDFYTPPPAVTPEPELAPSKPPKPAGIMSFAPAGPNIDHFRLGRQQSAPVVPSAFDPMAAAAKKKRPPPPPRPAAAKYVTAIYDFDGQGPDDLVLREGDRIKVITKTDSTDDWWEGELRGMQGSFPANYVE